MTDLKTCGGRNREAHTLEPADFGKHAGRKDGLQEWCKGCMNSYTDDRRLRVLDPELWTDAWRAAFNANTGAPEGALGCRLWLAGKQQNGYGVFQGVVVNRIVLAQKMGVVPSRSVQAAHLCHTPSCVTPDHIVPMAPTDHQAMDTAYRNNEVTIEELIGGAWEEFVT